MGRQATQVTAVVRELRWAQVAKVVGRLPSPVLRSMYARAPPQVVVGTPRALVEHFAAGVLRPDHVRAVVVDEVDFACQPALLPTLLPLLKRGGHRTASVGDGAFAWPSLCSIVFVSATITADVRRLAARTLHPLDGGAMAVADAVKAVDGTGGAAEGKAGTSGAAEGKAGMGAAEQDPLPPSIAHVLLHPTHPTHPTRPTTEVGSDNGDEDAALFRRWYAHACRAEAGPAGATARQRVNGVLVFCASQARLAHLHQQLDAHGLRSALLNADSTKEERRRALSGLATGKVNILLATEMASRGLDLPRLSHVYNYDPPSTLNSYLHRAGRVGRVTAAADSPEGYTIRPGTVVSVVRRAFVSDLQAWAGPSAADLRL